MMKLCLVIVLIYLRVKTFVAQWANKLGGKVSWNTAPLCWLHPQFGWSYKQNSFSVASAAPLLWGVPVCGFLKTLPISKGSGKLAVICWWGSVNKLLFVEPHQQIILKLCKVLKNINCLPIKQWEISTEDLFCLQRAKHCKHDQVLTVMNRTQFSLF